jgi:hypothetical protein
LYILDPSIRWIAAVKWGDSVTLARKEKFRLVIALIGAAAVIGAGAITTITGVFSGSGSEKRVNQQNGNIIHVSQHGKGNVVRINQSLS